MSGFAMLKQFRVAFVAEKQKAIFIGQNPPAFQPRNNIAYLLVRQRQRIAAVAIAFGATHRKLLKR